VVSSTVTETERLRLCRWDLAREAAFVEVTNTPAVMRWLGGVMDEAGIASVFERLHGYQRDHGHTFWPVERKADGAMLGFCGLKRMMAPGGEHLHGAMEIGWRLREDAWGQGFAVEAARACLDLAFGRFHAPFVIALTVPGNVPSQKLMHRLGMRRMPHLDFRDRRFPCPGDLNPAIVTVVTAKDWRAQP
jgi:RimJ/RimL family protein N-acetyltransferase